MLIPPILSLGDAPAEIKRATRRQYLQQPRDRGYHIIWLQMHDDSLAQDIDEAFVGNTFQPGQHCRQETEIRMATARLLQEPCEAS